MSQLIESIRLYNGVFSRLELHQARINRASSQLFGKTFNWQLQDLLMAQPYPTLGLHKCRVVYDAQSVHIEFAAYQARPIQTLKLVTVDNIDYTHKWADRSALEAAFALRDGRDDILIVKNGLITDSVYANIVFEQHGRWFTPDSPLLAGTMRQHLIENNRIEPRTISVDNFRSYNQFKLINALLQFDGPAFDVSNIS